MNTLAIDANRGYLTTEWAVYYADGRTPHFLTRLEARDRGAALTFVYERIPGAPCAHCRPQVGGSRDGRLNRAFCGRIRPPVYIRALHKTAVGGRKPGGIEVSYLFVR
jgi:hypothetical protein